MVPKIYKIKRDLEKSHAEGSTSIADGSVLDLVVIPLEERTLSYDIKAGLNCLYKVSKESDYNFAMAFIPENFIGNVQNFNKHSVSIFTLDSNIMKKLDDDKYRDRCKAKLIFLESNGELIRLMGCIIYMPED